MTLAIVADDLTGACDTGSLFARTSEVPVTVWPRLEASGDVRVLDTESRRLEAEAAAARVTDAARAIADPRTGRYFKKIDSTLRGRVGAEIEALMMAAGCARALVCPAFPAQRRVVRNRVLLIDGTPIAATALSRDPEFPRRVPGTSSVVDLLRPQLTRPIAWIPLTDVRTAGDALVARLTRLDGMVTVADAETDADLDALVDVALGVDPPPLLVGSAGLARALAARLGLLSDRVPLPSARRWLVIAGSLHPTARRQAEAARRAGLSVIASPDIPHVDTLAVARQLADDARQRLAAERFDVVAVTGGETALALWEVLGAERLDLIGSPAPGLALGRLRVPDQHDLWLVTKAGGFGDPDLFVTLAKAAAA